MAKPSPIEPAWPPCPGSEAIAVLMPMTSPLMSTSAPPELPGLIAASVWIASMTVSAPAWRRPSRCRCHRPVQRADDAGRHRALQAQRRADRHDLARRPRAGGVAELRRGEAGDAVGLDDGDVGRRVGADDLAVAVVPSLNVTCSWPPLAAPATTWLLVRIRPSALIMTPEPSPAWPLPLTSIETTLGSTARRPRSPS